MKLNQFKSTIFTIAAAVCLISTAGCASRSYDKGSATSAAVESAASQTAVLSTKVTDTLGSLNALVFKPEGDLRKQFDQFNAAVNGLQSASADLDARVATLQNQQQAYLDTWSSQLTNISSAEIRDLSAQRKATVTTNLAVAVNSHQILQGALETFQLDLRDIQTYLNNDLTAAGVSAIKDTVAKTKADAVPLRDSIKKLRSNFDALGKSLSPILPAAK